MKGSMRVLGTAWKTHTKQTWPSNNTYLAKLKQPCAKMQSGQRFWDWPCWMSESKWELSAVAEWAKVRMYEHSARSTSVWFGRVSSLAVSSVLSSCYTCRGPFVCLFAVCVSTLTFISEERFSREIISRFPKKQNLNKVDCQRSKTRLMRTLRHWRRVTETQNPWTVKKNA